MKSREVKPCAKPLVWWVGEADFEIDVALALNNVPSTIGIEFDLIHLKDDEALAYHRPRAPEVALAFVFPLTSSWSRARGTTLHGPPRLRSRAWPLGTPGLDGPQRMQVEADNSYLKLSFDVYETLRGHHRPWVLSFPEQFGSTQGETMQWRARTNFGD